MINGFFPQVRVERDEGGVVRKALAESLFFPEHIRTDSEFNWLGRPQRTIEKYFGITKEVEFSQEGKPLTERINVLGEYTVVKNYDPQTGKLAGSFIEVKQHG